MTGVTPGNGSNQEAVGDSVPAEPTEVKHGEAFSQQVSSIYNIFWQSCGSDPKSHPVSVCEPLSRLVANAHALLDRVQAGKLSSSDAQQRLQLDREQSVSAGDFAEKVSEIQRVFLGSCGLNPNAQPVSVCGPLSTLFGEAQALLGQVQMGELSPQDAEQQLKADRDQAKHSP